MYSDLYGKWLETAQNTHMIMTTFQKKVLNKGCSIKGAIKTTQKSQSQSGTIVVQRLDYVWMSGFAASTTSCDETGQWPLAFPSDSKGLSI